jgi:hypothetical protein
MSAFRKLTISPAPRLTRGRANPEAGPGRSSE